MSGIGKKIIFQKRFWLLRHVLFWLVSTIVLGVITSTITTGILNGFQTAVLFMPMNMLYLYVVLYWLVPRFLLRGRTLTFIGLFCGWALVGIGINFLFRAYILVPIRTGKPGPPLSLNFAYRQVFALGSFVVMNTIDMFGIFIVMYKHWMGEVRERMEVQQQKTMAELELLKIQLQPHFLFNSLKNLYSLVLEKDAKAPGMLLRLSALLNYVLYECKAPEVPLEKEIRVMQDYIWLEHERFGDHLDISTDFSGNVEGKMVAPMLFQPFVGHAFEQGAPDRSGSAWVSFELSVRDEELFFRVIKCIDPAAGIPAPDTTGINNVLRRLELLYPHRYQFRQETENELHITSLSMQLGAAPPGLLPALP